MARWVLPSPVVRLLLLVAPLFLCLIRPCAPEKAPNFTFVRSATSFLSTSSYHYIVGGGGTAGCPLAATLSHTHRVLLLERGGSPYSNPNTTHRYAFAATLADPSVSQPFVSEDGVINVRARVLGGGSSINIGFYSRAPPSYVAKAGWDAALVNRSYSWVEQVVAHAPAANAWQLALKNGLLEAGVGPYNGFTYDHLEGTKIGGTIFDSEGRRHGAADLLAHADPRRLTVLLHATVQRVVLEKRKGRVAARGVMFRDEEGKEHVAYLREGRGNEVVLSAGATGSPQILMLSGVGPKEELRRMGIEVVVEQPMVGEGMADNPANYVVVPSPSPVGLSLPTVVGISASGIYIEGSSGLSLPAPLGFNRRLSEWGVGGEAGGAPVEGHAQAEEPGPRRAPLGGLPLLRRAGGPAPLRGGDEGRRQDRRVAGVRRLPAADAVGAGNPGPDGDVRGEEPATAGREHVADAGAVLRGHGGDGVALPRRVPRGGGGGRRAPGGGRGRAEGGRRVDAERVAGDEPSGHSHDARQVHGGEDPERETSKQNMRTISFP